MDGRTDFEKVLELLQNGTEDRELDYKSHLDLSAGSKHSVELAKDCAAMANLPRGGYIVVGAKDNGDLATDADPIEPKQFDSATLMQKVRAYIDGPIHITSAAHEVNGWLVAVIYIRPDDTAGLPVVMRKHGALPNQDGQKKNPVFYMGQILTREGSVNTPMSYSQWEDALARYRERITREASEHTNALLQQILDAIRDQGSGGPVNVPLRPEMDLATLATALGQNFEAGDAGVTRIRRFLTVVQRSARPTPTSSGEEALDQLCLIALSAVDSRHDEVYEQTIDILADLYMNVAGLGGSDAYLPPDIKDRYLLAVLVRVFIVGSRLVRESQWKWVPPLVRRPVLTESSYEYLSWLRHGQVQASRNGLMRADEHDRDGTGGNMLALCRSHMLDHPELRSDCPDVSIEVGRPDELLDSLCRFDMLWCLIIATQPSDHFGYEYYASFAGFFGERTEPILDQLVRSEPMRRTLFVDTDDRSIAAATKQVIKHATRESQGMGFHTEIRPSPQVDHFMGQADE
ncbi:AlbA family DNA-binding domain-containing protein [Nocardia sp. NPDC055002]